MNIVVLGAGAVGGYFGGRLAEAGANVSFLVRERRAEQLRHNGLVVKSTYGDFEIRKPQVILSAREAGQCDLVILGVKNYHLHAALPQLKSLVQAGAKILPIINGIEHLELLKAEVGAENVLGGMCQIISTLDAEGVIHHTNKLHSLTFGPLFPVQTESCQQVKDVMDGANMDVVLSEHILVDIWTKYSFITAYSGVTTASRLPIDEILAVAATKQVYFRALDEMCTLAHKHGIHLPDNLIERNFKNISGYEKGSTSSMHQDLRKGLPLEVESLQGAALRLAEKYQLELLTIGTLYGLIKPYENRVQSS